MPNTNSAWGQKSSRSSLILHRDWIVEFNILPFQTDIAQKFC